MWFSSFSGDPVITYRNEVLKGFLRGCVTLFLILLDQLCLNHFGQDLSNLFLRVFVGVELLLVLHD